ncbi:MAG: FKBP-type peptidyl-prolyl cis-trans isomerase [Nitrospirae bacterium]|nr:FKBP-type peptidyl-prolyl cis-trans isomerase [Nitrospirota bacterium]
MTIVKKGDTVRIHYTGKLEDGTVFDSSREGATLEFKVGDGEFLARLEEGVVGMGLGESKTINMKAEEAYGPHHKERVFEYDKSRLPEDLSVETGRQFQMYRADGQPVVVTIVGVADSTVTLDCNHPLAGKDLVFDVTLEEIV